MSSKSIDGVTWSITGRLIALFTVSASALLFVVVAILYHAIAQHLDEEHEHLLTEIVHVLERSASARDGSVPALVEEMSRIATDDPASYSDPYRLRVLDENHRLLAESGGMSQIPLSAFGGRQTRRWLSPSGEEYLLATVQSTETSTLRSPFVVQVALNVTRDRILMRELRTTAVGLLVAALIVAALAGAVVVRHSLRPLEQIAAEVAEISAEELQHRLPVSRRPRELAGLVDAFNRVLDRLDRAFAGLSQFSANLAHELRTPLNNLHGEAEVALLQERSPAEYREVLMSSLEEYGRLSKMVEGLLFLARAESRETKPFWNRVDFSQEARAVCEFYGTLAEEKNASIAVEGTGAADADPVLVRRALQNLVGNSIGHLSNGGRVTISISTPAEGGVRVSVIDNGRGIAGDDLPHVLERFYRGSDARTNPAGGSGLGLAIVKSIMDLHGGTIDIASTAGRGTTVTLWFPPTHART